MAEKESWTGLTDAEAQEFHNYYIQGTIAFVAVAVVAHFLVWMWRPWIPGPRGYAASLIDGATQAAPSLLTFLA